MYLRAICHHALGHASAAAADYNACMNYSPKPGRVQSEESTMYQYLSFYQRELALYVYHHLDMPVVDFSMDCEIPALFKVTTLLMLRSPYVMLNSFILIV
jgi:hypothetical protein